MEGPLNIGSPFLCFRFVSKPVMLKLGALRERGKLCFTSNKLLSITMECFLHGGMDKTREIAANGEEWSVTTTQVM